MVGYSELILCFILFSILIVFSVATARVLCPVWPGPSGGGDGQGRDHPRHLPPGHHQEQARLQGLPSQRDLSGHGRATRGHVVHPLPGGHQLPLRV